MLKDTKFNRETREKGCRPKFKVRSLSEVEVSVVKSGEAGTENGLKPSINGANRAK